jgi:hypothetical protein
MAENAPIIPKELIKRTILHENHAGFYYRGFTSDLPSLKSYNPLFTKHIRQILTKLRGH